MPSLTNLKIDDKNANKGTERGGKQLDSSLSELGIGRGIVVDRNGKIIAGNKTVEKITDLGLTDEIVIVETEGDKLVVTKRTDLDLDSDDKAIRRRSRELAIADNRVAELDIELDPAVLEQYRIEDDVDLSQFYFDEELEEIMAGIDPHPDVDDEALDAVPEVSQAEPVVKRGDLFRLGKHRLMCGDSTVVGDVEAVMGGSKAELFLTDPPYGVSYSEKNRYLNSISRGNRVQVPIENDGLPLDEMSIFWENICKLVYTVTSDTASYYWFACQGGDQMMMMMMSISNAGWKVRHELIWVKNNHVLGRCDYNYKHEPILYGWKKKGTHRFYGSGGNVSVLKFDKPHQSKLHPTMKPVDLISLLIQNSSKKEEIITDPFLGSGTTLIAAEKTNRRCYGIEISPHYCEVIIRRWFETFGIDDFEHLNGDLKLNQVVENI